MRLLRKAPIPLVAAALAACTSSPAPVKDAPATSAITPPTPTAAASATAAPSASASDAASASAAPSSSTSTPASAGASAEPAPIVKDNKVEPIDDEHDARIKGLFDAIVKDDPALADPFWFPREPFLVLKDIKDPGKYWDQLHKTYAKDVHALHASRSWDGATFDRFERGSTPKWVKPGEEGNKIGYYRSFQGKLHYKAPDGPGELEVRVAITWQGHWYVTHLRKFKH